MTSFDWPTVAAIAAGCSGVTGFVVRALVLNRLDSLEASRDGMGARFGESLKTIERWQAQHDAVELDRQGRWPR